MKYLVLDTYDNGYPIRYKFELGAPVRPTEVPAVVYTTLTKGTFSDDVVTLQNALIAQGYLEGTADGDFGSRTETAVKAAQEAFGLEATGVADNDFLTKLYAAGN